MYPKADVISLILQSFTLGPIHVSQRRRHFFDSTVIYLRAHTCIPKQTSFLWFYSQTVHAVLRPCWIKATSLIRPSFYDFVFSFLDLFLDHLESRNFRFKLGIGIITCKLSLNSISTGTIIMKPYTGAGLGFRVGGREIVGRPHLIILKTWTVRWYILTLFEMLFWNFRDKIERVFYTI